MFEFLPGKVTALRWHARVVSVRTFLGWMALGLGAFALSGCATRSSKVDYAPAGFVAPDPVKPLDASRDYKVGVGDVLNISVFNVPTFSGDYAIDTLGRLRLPLVGDIQAQGLTTDELDTQVTARLDQTYLRNPDVRVTVKEAVARRITIDGSVANPGVYPVLGETTLIQSIAMARGLTQDANPRRVVVFRTVNGERMAAGFDLTDIRRGKMADPAIYQDDVIVVDGTKGRALLRDVITFVPFIGLFARF